MLRLYACIDCKMVRMVKREFHTAYMYLVPVLNDDDGRLPRYAIEDAVKR